MSGNIKREKSSLTSCGEVTVSQDMAEAWKGKGNNSEMRHLLGFFISWNCPSSLTEDAGLEKSTQRQVRGLSTAQVCPPPRPECCMQSPTDSPLVATCLPPSPTLPAPASSLVSAEISRPPVLWSQSHLVCLGRERKQGEWAGGETRGSFG